MRKIIFIFLGIITLTGVAVASYIPVSRAWVGFANDPQTVSVDFQNTWYTIDGFSDMGLPISASDFLVDPQKRGIIPLRPGTHTIDVYANFTKLSGANNVAYDFCFSLNEICIGPFSKTVINTPGTYIDSNGHLEFEVVPGALYGARIRNVTNADDLVFESATLKMTRVR